MSVRPCVKQSVSPSVFNPICGGAAGNAPNLIDILANVSMHTSPVVIGLQNITGVGFEPKALLPFGVAVSNDTPGIFGTFHAGVAVSSTKRAGIACSMSPALATSITRRRSDAANVISQNNADSLFLTADLDAFNADGFSLDWVTVQADGRRINYACLGGADLETNVTQHRLINTNAPISFPHGLSGRPTGLFIIGIGFDLTVTGIAGDAACDIGAWADNGQWLGSFMSQNAVTTTRTNRVLYTD